MQILKKTKTMQNITSTTVRKHSHQNLFAIIFIFHLSFIFNHQKSIFYNWNVMWFLCKVNIG